jgi:hypothetical protein
MQGDNILSSNEVFRMPQEDYHMKETSNVVYLTDDRDSSSAANSPMVQANQNTELVVSLDKDLSVDCNRDSNCVHTSSTSGSLSHHRTLFKVELIRMKDAHRFELELLQASQKEAHENKRLRLWPPYRQCRTCNGRCLLYRQNKHPQLVVEQQTLHKPDEW